MIRPLSYLRDELGWRLTEAAEATQRLAHRLNPEVPTPEDGDRYFDAGLAAGAGDFAAMLRLNPLVNMLERAGDFHGIAASEVVLQVERA